MKTIKVSDATYRAIAECAGLPFRSTGEQQPDGSWSVPLEDETIERLHQTRLPGENDDDAIMRMIRFYRGQQPS